jgi:hypothetical protein
MEIPLVHWIQWTNKIPMDISRSIGSIGSIGHFRLAISMAYYLHDVHMLVITSFKDMLIDQLKKQTSDGNSTCPLDPLDTRNSNGQLAIHLTNGMSNGLLIFPLDILHRYWALIIFYAQTYYRSIQCRRKLLLIGGAGNEGRRLKEIFKFRVSEMPFPGLRESFD